MACYGSKAIQSRRSKTQNLEDMSLVENPHKNGGRKKSKNRKHRKEILNAEGGRPTEISHGGFAHQNAKDKNFSKHKNSSASQKSVIRKIIDPEMAKYFSEIASILEGSEIDPDERLILCANALEESRGKELQLASDKIISHTMETLLKGCDLDQLCNFLLSCAKDFPAIAMDQSGSRVAETALRSLAICLQDKDAYSVVEQTLIKICEEVASNSVNIMQNCHGSHVLRSLLCLCKGTPLDSWETFHVTKRAHVLADRLNSSSRQSSGNNPSHVQQGFPELLKFFVRGMLRCAKEDIAILRLNSDSSLVLQTTLKLLADDDLELLHVIPILLGFHEENTSQEELENTAMDTILDLLKDAAFSRLMEVILVVAPETLYNEILTKVFKKSLFEISSHQFGNFVVQALISSTREQDQMNLIWEELGTKFKELLQMRKSGVIASLLAACQRLHTHEHESCQALAAAVRSESESPSCIVPRILVLESCIFSEERKISVLGCFMLQTTFKYSNDIIQQYISSLTSMEADQLLEAAKDAGGGRVLEAFLSSDASAKQKHKVIAKLQGHYGDLSMQPSGSFTVEKCFSTGNVSHKEVIVSELLSLQDEISRTNHGPHLLKKLDVARFAARPEQWRSMQASKQATYQEFSTLFSSKTDSRDRTPFVAASSRSLPQNGSKKKRKGLHTASPTELLGSDFADLEISMAKMGLPVFKRFKAAKDEKFWRKNGGIKKPTEFVSKNKKRKTRIGGDGVSTPFVKKKKLDNW